MVKGVIAGNFDVIHPGYIKMFKECADNCDCLVVFLHSDPSIERPEKLKPILEVYIKGNNISLVVDKKYILGGGPGFDITKVIVEKLNKDLPSLNLK